MTDDDVQPPQPADPNRPEWRRASISELIAKATGSVGEPNAYCEYSAVDPAQAAAIAGVVGANVAGFAHAIDVSTIRHILKRHGPKGKADRSVTLADFARLPTIVGQPDSIRAGSTKGDGLPRIEYRKRDGGDWLVVEEVRSGRARLSLVSMYKEKAIAS